MSRQTRLDWFSSRFRKNLGRRHGMNRRPLGLQPLEDRRLMAVVTVDTLNDTIDFNDGVTSLREAIFATNTVPGADTIEFAASLTADGPATILLTQGELAITDALAIQGPGAELLTIDASGSDTNLQTFGNGARIFNIDDHNDSVIRVSIHGLTLTGGDPNGNGGAILSREQLSIDAVVLAANHARGGGAIAQTRGDAEFSDSKFLDNTATGSGAGGAILIEGFPSGQSIVISGNQFTGNSAANGGAIAALMGSVATLVVDSNTITENRAASSGGGIFISNSTSQATIHNSTISGNQARNGAGIFASQTRDLAVFNTVISNNQSPLGARGGAGGGAYLLNSDVSFTECTIAGNEASSGGGIESRMGELAINFSTIADNKALSGRGGGIVSDQSRFSLVGSAVTGNSAQSIANGGGGIWLTPGLSAMPVLADSRIEGNSTGGTGGGIDFRTGGEGQNSASLTLHNVTIAHNTASGAGGGINAVSTSGGSIGPGLVLFGGEIVGNTSVNGTGGGIHSTVGGLNVQETTISENRARGSGGGIMLPAAASPPFQVSIVGATFDGNIASFRLEGPAIGDGGALAILGAASTVSIANTSFTSNSARAGGAIFRRAASFSSPFSVTGSIISGNTAELRGGGLYNDRGMLSIDRSTIEGNRSLMPNEQTGRGGGVFNRTADLSINASSISGNSTVGRGGGVYHNQGDLVITSSTIAGNSAGENAGGVYGSALPLDRILIQSSTVSSNSSSRTGGMDLRGDTTIRHTTIVGNTGGGIGAGGVSITAPSQRFELDHTIIAKNTVGESVSPAPDLRVATNMNSWLLRYSLIGDSTGTPLVEAPVGSPGLNGNLIGKAASAGGSGVIDPLLGALTNNGGSTQTHALLPGSPALDAGSWVSGAPLGYDQRGKPYTRAADGTGDGSVRIDIGAYESQGMPEFTPGDFNRDGFVDARDYTVWRVALGSRTAPFAGADASGNGIVD